MELTLFKGKVFLDAVKTLIKELKVPINYVANEPTTAKEILKDTYKDNSTFALVDDVYFVGMVDDAAFEGNESLSVDKIKSDYDGILIFGITLHKRENNLLPTRSQLAEISRAFNREFYYTPVVLVFKYSNTDEEFIAFANTERLKYKQEWREGEKVGKVSLLRDINFENTHAGHERILLGDGKEKGLRIDNKIDSFAKLYNYWQEVFSVSILNKKFYKELQNWYFWAIQEVSFPNQPNRFDYETDAKFDEAVKEHKAKNVIRLLTRILFIWFIKEKKLIPEDLFDEQTIANKFLVDFTPQKPHGNFATGKHNSKYYRAILQNLFFATLNQEMGKRQFRNDKQHQNVTNLMRYKSYFKDPDYFVQLMEDVVPFMNGGLFECLDKPHPEKKGKQGGDIIIYADGFSDRTDNFLTVPDYLFFDVDEDVDLSDDFGSKSKIYKNAKTRGLLEILKSYKFTITENTPIEEDVALDPELLGKVFENLLASYNPETKTTARKQTGSFYTPREIVNYMVDESLIAYLSTQLSSLKGGAPEGGGGSKNSFQGDKLNNLPYLKTFRKELRNNLTPAEAALWKVLKGKQLVGRKFRRQHSVANYILDFYCPAEKLAIELDGQGHFESAQEEYDRERDLFLKHVGIKVLRFENKIVWNDLEGLLDAVKAEFGWRERMEQEPPRPSDTPPLQGGERLEEDLNRLFSYDETNPFENNSEIQKQIIKAFDKIKILDPAAGSGAFPMGALQKMVHVLHKVDPHNAEWKQRQIDKVNNAIESLEKIDDAKFREQSIKELQAQIKDIEDAFENNELDYGRKLFLIENCIYGVDIQSIATQISKLRFFISLIVDQRIDKSKPNFGIRPLPNLETKFVAANTLVGIDKPDAQLNLFDKTEVKILESQLKKVRHKIFSSKSPRRKRELREEDKKLRERIAELLEEGGMENKTARQLASWDPYDQNTSSPFFDSEWMFDIRDGFDVVIGNPPYKQVPKGIYSVQQYPYSEGKDKGKQNLYKIFVEASKNLTKKDYGVACLIVQSSLLCDLSSTYTRELLLKTCLVEEIIEFPKTAPTKEGQVFENVLQGTCIYRFINRWPKPNHAFVISSNNDVTTLKKLKHERIIQNSLFDLYPETFYIPLVKKGDFTPINEIKNNSKPLGFYLKYINQGDINLTSSKDYFTNNDTGVKLFRGKNVQRFYLIEDVEEYVYPDYKLEKVEFNLQHQFLVCQEITGTTDKYRLHFCKTPKNVKYLFGHTANKLTVKNNNHIDSLSIILNSKFLDWLFRKTSTNNHVMGYEIVQFPIPNYFQSNISLLDKFYNLIHFLSHLKSSFKTLFERINDAIVFNLYFPSHMKERGIDVLEFVEWDIKEVMQKHPSASGISPQGEKFWEFEQLSHSEKEQVIEQLHQKWTDPDNEVVKRMGMFKEKSPDILGVILES
ncbi:MAG: DUF559 domain-containing protein [Chlorobi bacterium]|nr:DUF559 domain-containing protein [Chlorobiota bacterium]